MIVEPTPTDPSSPLRRALRRAGVVLPVAMLGAAVAAGVLGTKPEPGPPVALTPPVAVVPGESPGDEPTPGPVAVTPVAAAAPPPAAFGGLAAITTGELLTFREDGLTPVAVAVLGFLRVDGAAADCAGLPGGMLGPWCERHGSLGDRPWASTGSFSRTRQPHVHLTIPAGVRLPEPLVLTADEPGEGGVRVLVVGRFTEEPTSCAGFGPACDEGFVVERFAWADGARIGLTPLVEARLETGAKRANPFQFVTDRETLPIAAALVWPDGVARLDPAAASLAAQGPPSEPVWFVRVLARAGDDGEGPVFRWLLLAERDLRVLGTGPLHGGAAGAGDGAASGSGAG